MVRIGAKDPKARNTKYDNGFMHITLQRYYTSYYILHHTHHTHIHKFIVSVLIIVQSNT
jgi:hypothetical protein